MKHTDTYLHLFLATTEANRQFGIYSSTMARLTETLKGLTFLVMLCMFVIHKGIAVLLVQSKIFIAYQDLNDQDVNVLMKKIHIGSISVRNLTGNMWLYNYNNT